MVAKIGITRYNSITEEAPIHMSRPVPYQTAEKLMSPGTHFNTESLDFTYGTKYHGMQVYNLLVEEKSVYKCMCIRM